MLYRLFFAAAIFLFLKKKKKKGNLALASLRIYSDEQISLVNKKLEGTEATLSFSFSEQLKKTKISNF